MSDNTNFASDDIGGVQYPRVKVTWGADGTANDVSGTNPAPVQLYYSGASIDPNASTPVAHDTSRIFDGNGSTSLTPKFAKITVSGATTQDVVAAVTSKKIRVLAAAMTIGAAGNVTFRSGGSTTLTGAFPIGSNGGFSLPFNPVGWFETVAGEKLDLLLSASGNAGGCITYIEV